MLRLRIINIEGDRDVAHYTYEVDVNGKCIADGEVNFHRRAEGWIALVRRIVEQEEAKAIGRESKEAMGGG